MRSRSSVLSHVLGSNASIIGYRELHYSYTHNFDSFRMKLNLHREFTESFQDKLLLDKLLHNRFSISQNFFRRVSPKVIILLRSPYRTITSILKLGDTTGISWYKDLTRVSEYYCSRLSELVTYGEILGGNYFFIDSEDIVINTDFLLATLSHWLSLREPLSKEYSIFSKTAKTGFGDPTNSILTGFIHNTQNDCEFFIPNNYLKHCRTCHDHCYDFLKKNQFSFQP